MNEQQQQAAAYLNEVALQGKRIAERGVSTYGRQTWDSYVDTVSTAIAAKANCSVGEAQMSLTDHVRGHDDPVEIIRTLAEDPDRLERILAMPPSAQRTELARVEAQCRSHGRPSTGRTPAWMTSDAEGHVSDAEWSRTFGDQIKDDQEWSRQFQERLEKKYGVGSGRFKAGG